jgi:membrane protein implicated in regulation of membrane protease activity
VVLSEFFVIFFVTLGATGVAVTVFIVIMSLADKPANSLIAALIVSYLLYFVYITVVNRILKRKEESRATDLREG